MSQTEDYLALEVRSVPQTSDSGPLPWDLYYVQAPGPFRLHLTGFSFFGEIGSFEPDGSPEYIQIEKSDANDAGDCNYNVVVTDPAKLSFSNARWMKTLSCRRINFSRIFIFPAYKPVRYFPFKKVSGLYDLRTVSDDYKLRLDDYLVKAKEKGIVVCLSLFADQMLRIGAGDDAFLANPFRNALNTADTNFISIAAGEVDNDIRRKFYTISEPGITPQAPLGWASLHEPAAWNSWTDAEKLYAVQRNLVTEIVNASRPHWNVMYEISNEPRSTNDSALRALTLEWIKKVGSWLDGLLWDQINLKHKRLIMIDVESGSFRADVFSALRKDDYHLKVDLFSFHGDEWNAGSLSNNITALGNIDIKAQSGWPARKLRAFPLAIVFDTDANRPAQDDPGPYLRAVRAVNGNFNYRWSDVPTLTHRLEQINRANPPTGFSSSYANNVVTYRWDPVPQAGSYDIVLYQTDPPHGPTSVTLPPPLRVNGGTTNQAQVTYPVLGAVAAIKANMPPKPGFSGTETTAESTRIKVHSGLMFDCEVTGSNLASGMVPLQYNGSITLRNLGFAPWTLYSLPEVPGQRLTFGVRVDVYDNPQGTGWIANGRWFLLQPPPPSTPPPVRTGESSTFQISYLLPNRPGQLYLIFNFDLCFVNPDNTQNSSSRIKTLLTRQVHVQ